VGLALDSDTLNVNIIHFSAPYWVGLALDSGTLGQVNHNPGVP